MLDDLKQEFNRPVAEYIPIVSGGLIDGVLAFVISISLAALVFSGDLTAFLPEGIGVVLFTSMVVSLICAFTSSFRGVAAFIQEAPVGVLALAALHIGADVGDPGSEGAFVTILMMLTLTSLSAGLVFVALWRFQLGHLMRIIPYPVTGGFLAATGLVLFQGSMTIMTDKPFEVINPGSIFDGEVIVRWIPGMVFGLVLLVMTRRIKHYFVVPGMLVLVLITFVIAVQLVGSTLQEAQDNGWMLGPFPEGKSWQPVFLYDLSAVQWSIIFEEASHIPIAVAIAVIGMLLNATGMETSTRQELDVDRELRSVGIANLISAAGGGMVGFPSLSATMLANRMGAVSRLVGVVIAAFFAAVILAGPSLVAMFPKVVLGGLLCYLGLSMMADWVYDGLSRMQRSDYAIIIIILAAVAAIGYLEGIVIGIVVAVALFVVDYSRLTVIKASYSGAHFRSNVERPFHHRRQLHADGDKLFILQLEGYLFFGTANTMLNRIIERLRDPESQPLHYLVLDFSRIRRLDSSAIQSLSKIRQTVEAQGITLIFAGVAQQISAIIKKNDFDLTESQSFRQMPDSDTAIEWCEERLLREARVTNILRSETLREHINAIFPDLLPFDDLARYLEALQVSAGDYLAHQGEPSDAMFFVEAGKIRVQLESAGAEPLQLRKVHAGAILGEVSIYSEKPRSASLVVDEDGVVYRLSSEALRRMESEDQALATAFHKFIAHVLAERLADMTEALDVALR